MTSPSDPVLAQLSLDAYSDAPVALPPGFAALDATSLGLALAPGESFANGVFHSGNGAALLTDGSVDGTPAIVLAFRGSDDKLDSQEDLNGINQAYASFGSLVAAVDAASAATGLPVVVTGHSLGGALAQLYMASHPDIAGAPGHEAVTFGSPGAVLPPGEDARITNYVIADDPAVVLGAHRAEIGALLRADPALAGLAADRIAQALPDLTRDEALASLSNLTVNYDNRGDIVLLPGQDGRLDPAADLANLSRGDEARHAPELYVQEVAAAGQPGASLLVPAAPTDDPTQTFLHTLYDGDGRDPDASAAILRDLAETWAGNRLEELGADGGALDQLAGRIEGYAHDLGLL